MAAFDLVIRNGTVVDGTGIPGYRTDVGVRGDRIEFVGRIHEKGGTEIDADGHVVSPGFIDGHTHMDAHLFWDPLGTSSCWHGVTSVVMGNCGFTLAPSKDGERELVIRNLEGVEDIPGDVLEKGVPWEFERFREYLDAIDRLPKGINCAGYIGHSALRTWAMGERAFEQAASEEDLALMAAEMRDALQAGAVGFTTSRSGTHVTSDGRPIASRAARWEEVVALVGEMSKAGGGIFELSNESVISSPDDQARGEYTGRLRDLAVATGVPTTFGVTAYGGPHRSKALLELIDATADAGGQMFGQSLAMPMMVLYSFKTKLPFDGVPAWAEMRKLPLAEQAAVLRRPDDRKRLVDAVRNHPYGEGDQRVFKPDYELMLALQQPMGANPKVADLARARNADPVDVIIDLSLEKGFDQFFTIIFGNSDPDEVQRIVKHPRVVTTFTDSGAHVETFIYTSMHTRVLADWVRERQVLRLEEAIRMMTLVPATAWNFADRGLVREGFVADLNVFDPARVAPELPSAQPDLPGGVMRLTEKARGFLATVVSGEVVLRDGEPTGALPGKLIRRRNAS
jgi:N-acyl-D-amino-acid deacylase